MGKSQCKLNLNLIFRRFPGLKFKKISVKMKCFGAVENQEDSEEFPRIRASIAQGARSRLYSSSMTNAETCLTTEAQLSRADSA